MALRLYERRLFDETSSGKGGLAMQAPDAFEKIGLGLYLLANLAVNLVSLQVSLGCYAYLENYRQFLFADITEV